jgi:hypothetical protein
MMSLLQAKEERLGLLQQQLLTASKNHGTEMQEAWQSIAQSRQDALRLKEQLKQEHSEKLKLAEQVCIHRCNAYGRRSGTSLCQPWAGSQLDVPSYARWCSIPPAPPCLICHGWRHTLCVFISCDA